MPQFANGRLPDRLDDVVLSEFGNCPAALNLVAEFLQRRRSRSSRQQFVTRLIRVGRDGADHRWEVRRLAALMLQHQALQIPPDRTGEFRWLLGELGLLVSDDAVAAELLREGYTTTEFGGFVQQFRDHLARLDSVLGKIRGMRTSASALRDFVEVSRQECKLALARYLFTPAEVVGRIRRFVRLSTGESNQLYGIGQSTVDVSLSLPAYEREILRRLVAGTDVYWVADNTPAELNRLVEYPLGAVTLAIKPPGSWLEFEIKRAGRRGPQPLSVAFRRNGRNLPPSHRLDGASMGSALEAEASQSSLLAHIYHKVHGRPAPLSRVQSIKAKVTIPAKCDEPDERHLLDFLSKPRDYGQGYDEMRTAMQQVVEAFTKEHRWNLDELQGRVGLTLQFLNHTTPSQAVLSHTSSFRLDRLAEYLSPEGPHAYFAEGLKRDHTGKDDKRLADLLLDEVLGLCQPPAVRYRTYQQYVEAVMQVPQNRATADRVFVDVLNEVGCLWGTLLAVRGCSNGESFVGRNVGLRTVWDAGRWQVKMVLMDHDDLHLPGRAAREFRANHFFPGAIKDEVYIIGAQNMAGCVTTMWDNLRAIYRVDAGVAAEGRKRLFAAQNAACLKTQEALLHDECLRACTSREFIQSMVQWDAIAQLYLQAHRRDAGNAWRELAHDLLRKQRQGSDMAKLRVLEVERFSPFLERYPQLFDTANGKSVESQ